MFDTVILQIQPWMNTIAYCFGYGTILTKMGRVYKIFHNPTTKKNRIVSITPFSTIDVFFYLHENQVFFICTMQGITPFNTVFYMHENHDNSKCAMQGIKDWHMVLLVLLIAGVGVVLLIIETAFLRPNLALLPSEEYESGKDVSLQRNVTDLAVT